jgi:HEAT repeat protein
MKAVVLALIAMSSAVAGEISPAIRSEIAGGHFAEARRQCLEVTARDGSDVDHWICVARMSAWLGDYRGAVSAYDTVVSGLESGDEGVMTAAAAASGRLKLEPALPLLVRGLNDGRRRIVRSSAEALVELGPSGVRALEKELKTCRGPSAAVALEALGRAVPAQPVGGAR